MTDPDRTQSADDLDPSDAGLTVPPDDVTLMPPSRTPPPPDSPTIPCESAGEEPSGTLALPAESAVLPPAPLPVPAEAPATLAPPTVAPPRCEFPSMAETLAPPEAPAFTGESTEHGSQQPAITPAESSGTLLDAHLISGPTARVTDKAPPVVPRVTGPGFAVSDAPSTVARPEAVKTGKFHRVTLPKVEGYEVLSELGRGGMGVVYRARQIGLNRIVALKMVLTAGRASADELARFRAEAEAVAYLHHPNIVQVYDVGTFEGLPYFSLEFCPGGTLSDRVGGKPQPPRLAARIVRDLARAVHHAHQRNILHRDLKPANVLLALPYVDPSERETRSVDRKTQKVESKAPSAVSENKATEPALRAPLSGQQRIDAGKLQPGEGDLALCIPKITDFGLAKRLEGDAGQTRDGSVMGTPSYMAPEQAQGKVRELGPPADVYALGAILYDLLTGGPPFRGDTVMDTLHQVINREPVSPQDLHAKVPADLDTICLKCLEKDPSKRYASADALAEDLRRFLDGEPILARPTAWWEKVAKWARRRPAAAALAVVVALALVGLCGGGYVLAEQEADRAAEETKLRGLAVSEKQRAETQRERAEKLQAEAEEQSRREADLKDAALAAKQAAETQRKRAEVLKGLAEEQSRREADLKNAALAAKQAAETQRKRAEELKGLAEEHFRKACAAVDTLLARIGHERLAHEPRMEQIRRELLQKAAAFYEGFLRERGDDPSVKWQTARTQKNLGDIQEMLGAYDQAEERYRAALALFVELRSTAPDDRRYGQDLAATQHNLGLLLSETGRTAEAEKALRSARDLRLGLIDPMADGDARGELAASDHALGLLLERRGNFNDAETAFKAALEQQKKVAEGAAADEHGAKAWREVARTDNSLGRVAEATGRATEAEGYYDSALAILTRLVAAAPRVPEVRQELGQTYDNLGRLRRDTDPAAATKDYEEAVHVGEKLVEDFPATPAYRQDWAAALNNLGILRLAAGRSREADEAFGRALSLKERLAAEIHWVADFRRDFGAGLNNRGIQLKTQDRSAEADKTFIRAVKVLTDLVTEHPDTPDYQRELARTLVNHALVRQADRKADEAETLLQKAVTIQEKLVARPDALPEYRSEMYRTHVALGALYHLRIQPAGGRNAPKAREELARAESEYRSAIDGFKELAASYAKEPDYRYQEALASSALAGLLAARGQSMEARTQWELAAGLLVALAEQHAEIPGYRLDLGRTYNDWALHCAVTGAMKEAGELWGRASVALAELVRAYPKDAAARQELAKVENNRAVLALKANRLADATAAYRRSVEALEGLPAGSRPSPEYSHSLMASHRELAEQLSATGATTQEVEAEWRHVAESCRSLVKQVPNNPQYASELGIVAHKLGQYLLLQNRPEASRPILDEATAAQRTALKLSPTPAFKALLGQHLKLLKEVLFQLSDHAAAAAVVGELVAMRPADGSGRHELAAADLARCATLASTDKKLSESQRQETSQGYSDRAMVELQEAVKDGFKDARELNKRQFDILRQRADFKELAKTFE
jgi:serine/threonine protein kinase/tetratricopeptide (TPR) repeat protein